MSSQFSVYISCPISVPIGILKKFASIPKNISSNCRVSYWDRKETYHFSHTIENCDAFVMILPDNQWGRPIGILPPGCRKELDKAIAYHRPIYLGYINSLGNPTIYKADTNDNFIKGIKGTSGVLETAMKTKEIDYAVTPQSAGREVREVEYPEFITYSENFNASTTFSYEQTLLLRRHKR